MAQRKITEGLGTFIRRMIRAELQLRQDTGGDFHAEKSELETLTRALDAQIKVEVLIDYKPARSLKVTQIDLIGVTAEGGCDCRVVAPDSSRSSTQVRRGRSRSR